MQVSNGLPFELLIPIGLLLNRSVKKMDYKEMSLKKLYKSTVQSENALNAGDARNLLPNSSITQQIIDEYGPFTRFHLENKNTTITLQVSINGIALGDNSIISSQRDIFLLPSSALDILPEEDNLKITKIAIKNLDASTNTSNGDIVWDIANY